MQKFKFILLSCILSLVGVMHLAFADPVDLWPITCWGTAYEYIKDTVYDWEYVYVVWWFGNELNCFGLTVTGQTNTEQGTSTKNGFIAKITPWGSGIWMKAIKPGAGVGNHVNQFNRFLQLEHIIVSGDNLIIAGYTNRDFSHNNASIPDVPTLMFNSSNYGCGWSTNYRDQNTFLMKINKQTWEGIKAINAGGISYWNKSLTSYQDKFLYVWNSYNHCGTFNYFVWTNNSRDYYYNYGGDTHNLWSASNFTYQPGVLWVNGWYPFGISYQITHSRQNIHYGYIDYNLTGFYTMGDINSDAWGYGNLLKVWDNKNILIRYASSSCSSNSCNRVSSLQAKDNAGTLIRSRTIDWNAGSDDATQSSFYDALSQVDEEGNVYVPGRHDPDTSSDRNKVMFSEGNQWFSIYNSSTSSTSIFIFKINSWGNVQWILNSTANQNETIDFMRYNKNTNILQVFGSFNGTNQNIFWEIFDAPGGGNANFYMEIDAEAGTVLKSSTIQTNATNVNSSATLAVKLFNVDTKSFLVGHYTLNNDIFDNGISSNGQTDIVYAEIKVKSSFNINDNAVYTTWTQVKVYNKISTALNRQIIGWRYGNSRTDLNTLPWINIDPLLPDGGTVSGDHILDSINGEKVVYGQVLWRDSVDHNITWTNDVFDTILLSQGPLFTNVTTQAATGTHFFVVTGTNNKTWAVFPYIELEVRDESNTLVESISFNTQDAVWSRRFSSPLLADQNYVVYLSGIDQAGWHHESSGLLLMDTTGPTCDIHTGNFDEGLNASVSISNCRDDASGFDPNAIQWNPDYQDTPGAWWSNTNILSQNITTQDGPSSWIFGVRIFDLVGNSSIITWTVYRDNLLLVLVIS